MRIVLLDDIPNLGEAGSVVEVKNGYARNFLLPRRLAECATRDALNRIELIRRAAEAKRARRMAEAADKFAALGAKVLTIRAKAGTQSRIFGAVTATVIADQIYKQFGIQLDRRQVMLDEPIKHLGEYTVPLRASADVTGEIRLSVEPEVKPGVAAARSAAAARAAAAARGAEQKPAEAAAAESGDDAAEQAAADADAHEKYEHHEEEAEEQP